MHPAPPNCAHKPSVSFLGRVECFPGGSCGDCYRRFRRWPFVSTSRCRLAPLCLGTVIVVYLSIHVGVRDPIFEVVAVPGGHSQIGCGESIGGRGAGSCCLTHDPLSGGDGGATCALPHGLGRGGPRCCCCRTSGLWWVSGRGLAKSVLPIPFSHSLGNSRIVLASILAVFCLEGECEGLLGLGGGGLYLFRAMCP